MSRYDDIINLPHHVSATRKPMPMANRAAQFAPFAALSGHDDAIAETARLTDGQRELTAEESELLSRRLAYALENRLEVTITYFLPDPLKPGGSYRQLTGRIRQLSPAENLLILADRRTLPLDSLLALSSPSFSDL